MYLGLCMHDQASLHGYIKSKKTVTIINTPLIYVYVFLIKSYHTTNGTAAGVLWANAILGPYY